MISFVRRSLGRSLVPALALVLGASLLGSAPVAAQQAKEPPPKEVTDGFFDVPARDTSQDGPEIGLGSYIITGCLAGGAMFVLCKSARRS